MTQHATSSNVARVAVVGAGAWGTTLAILVAQQEPVLLLARSQAEAAVMERDRSNERRLPGIPLPARVRVTADGAELA
ncbi:MAG TPA: hypothetical protein VHL56_06120, partial [Candidatus Limnocylindrales bacterium]|nr:hypothetical protein [Candidatus Limnocylindrales bacterium]